MRLILIASRPLTGLDNDIHHHHLCLASVLSDHSAEDRIPGSPWARARQRRSVLNVGARDLACACIVVISPSCTFDLLSDLVAVTLITLSVAHS